MKDESTVTPCASATSASDPQDAQTHRKRGGYRPRRVPSTGEDLRLMGPDPGAGSDEIHVVQSEDREAMVTMRPVSRDGRTRLYLERVHRTTATEIISHSMLFKDEHEFRAWCDSDPIRFRPNVTQKVRRIAHELFESKR